MSTNDKGASSQAPSNGKPQQPSPVTVAEALSLVRVLTAAEIRQRLDQYVEGQDEPKLLISVLLSMHLRWHESPNKMHRSPNALVVGPTGVGKTHTLRVASDCIGVPFLTVDGPALVPSGIVGYRVESLLRDLVLAARAQISSAFPGRHVPEDVARALATRGVIFIDEFDKLAGPADRASEISQLNISIQRRLLKFIEGSRSRISDEHDDRSLGEAMDSSGVLVICGGSFAGIEDSRIKARRPEVLKRDLAKSDPSRVVSFDVISFGFIPELVARLPVLVCYSGLDKTALYNILKNPAVSPVEVWKRHFEKMGKKILFPDEVLLYVSERAASLSLGARGLVQILFPKLARIAYDLEQSKDPTVTISISNFLS